MTRFVLTGLLSLATLTGITGTAPLTAQEPPTRFAPDHRHHERRYEVFYRTDCNCPWRYYASYGSDWEAHRAERHLERRGYEARVRHPEYRRPW